jgi:hypothetical protein
VSAIGRFEPTFERYGEIRVHTRLHTTVYTPVSFRICLHLFPVMGGYSNYRFGIEIEFVAEPLGIPVGERGKAYWY